MSEINLNDVVTQTVRDAEVITVEIDDTLSISGEAADAKAVGDALALKADASSVNTIKVNEQEADNQGQILLNGGDIPMSDSDTTTLAAAITAAGGKTAADIYMSSEEQAPTISAKITALEALTGADIKLNNTESAPTIAAKIATVDAKTAADIVYDAQNSVTVAAAIAERVKTEDAVLSVNNNLPDANGNVTISKVAMADNLDSSKSQTASGEFLQRTTGGSASIQDGTATLVKVQGNSVHTGFTPESLDFSVTSDTCTAAITDMDTFREAMENSGTLTLTYSTSGSSWSEAPTDYGITVTGTPEDGDTIVAVWVKEVRGTITNAEITGFSATGWNLYNQTATYAKVVKYSDEYGYAISGSYTKIEYSQTETGMKTDITPESGILFDVPDDGYVWVTGGGSDTAIWPTWSDWQTGYKGSYQAYNKTTIDLSGVMDECFHYGLCAVGTVRDEIDLSNKVARQWIEVLDYNAENLAAAESSGRPYIYDEDYIYLVKASATTTSLTNELAVTATYTANGHGMEMFEGTAIAAGGSCLYGLNLKDRLERDVVVKSTDIADNLTTNDSQKVLSAKQGKILNDRCQDMFKSVTYTYKYNINANSSATITKTNFGMTVPYGYKVLALRGAYTGSKYVALCSSDPNTENSMYVYNISSSNKTNVTAKMIVTYVKTGMGI